MQSKILAPELEGDGKVDKTSPRPVHLAVRLVVTVDVVLGSILLISFGHNLQTETN
jgi:hypothetical protein